jgi:hypothetical protein
VRVNEADANKSYLLLHLSLSGCETHLIDARQLLCYSDFNVNDIMVDTDSLITTTHTNGMILAHALLIHGRV